MIEMTCEQPLKLRNELTGEEIEVKPIKVWRLNKNTKVALVRLSNGRYKKVKVPDDYECY